MSETPVGLRLLLAVLLLLISAGEAAAQYTLSEQEPQVGRPVTVTLPQQADTLTVIYRPNSIIADTAFLATGGLQTVEWIPSQAGVVALSVPRGTSQNVSVRFRRLPARGILVLILAGTILFGGAVFAFRKLFQDVPPATAPTKRPDT